MSRFSNCFDDAVGNQETAWSFAFDGIKKAKL
jgi:hypothetical protein